METYIQIKKKYLIFRDDANNLVQLVRKKLKKDSSKTIFFDFSYVDFISRSFIDEFLNNVNELKKNGIKLRVIHLKPALREFIAQVEKTKSKIQAELLK